MWSVIYVSDDDAEYVFISGISSVTLARRIADELMEEGFVTYAYVEED